MPIPADYAELSPTGLDMRRVEALWSFCASSPGEHIVLPDGRMDLIVRYRVTPLGRVTAIEPAIIGPSAEAAPVPVEEGDRFLGLRYRAGWGGASLGVDPTRLRNSGLHGAEAANVLGDHVIPLHTALTPDDLRLALIEVGRQRAETVNQQVPMSTVKAIDLLHLTGGRIAITEMSLAVDVPERTLRRHIEQASGLSFKTLAAVLRFQRTIRLLAAPANPGLSLAQAALEGGYSDQAHMTREFRRYGGFTPGKRPPVAFGSLPIGQLAEIFNNDVSGAL
jgi:AraC-like DNA-binding protein